MGRSKARNMGLPLLGIQYLVNYSFWVIYYNRRLDGENGNLKGWRQLLKLLKQLDSSFLRYMYFQENIWNENWCMTHRLDQSTRAIPPGGYTARFSPRAFFISSNIQSRQKKSAYIGTGGALFTNKEPGSHKFISRESCWNYLPPTPQQSQNVHLDKVFMEHLKIFYSQDCEI